MFGYHVADDILQIYDVFNQEVIRRVLEQVREKHLSSAETAVRVQRYGPAIREYNTK